MYANIKLAKYNTIEKLMRNIYFTFYIFKSFQISATKNTLISDLKYNYQTQGLDSRQVSRHCRQPPTKNFFVII